MTLETRRERTDDVTDLIEVYNILRADKEAVQGHRIGFMSDMGGLRGTEYMKLYNVRQGN